VSTTDTAVHPGVRSLRERTPNAARRASRDRAMRAVLLVTLVAALVPLAGILFVVVAEGLPALSVEFFTQAPPFSYREFGGGYLPQIFGTLYMMGIATVLAVPFGIAAAIFIVEYRDSPLATPIRFFTDVMTGVPSIFVGLFVYSALVIDQGLGFGTLPGAVALAVLMLPIVVRSSEEVLGLVPHDLRNAAYGLGARRWQVVTRVVLPAAGPGLATGSMLAVARGAGETAPLLLTALGANVLVTELVDRPQTSLTLQILDEARTALPASAERAWAGSLTLIALVLAFTVGARLLARRSQIGAGD
jgi:phosphate transport system permease protein